jgi:hypothetical protein
MTALHLPYVKMPQEFITLLKANLSVTPSSPSPIFDVIRPNPALYRVLETAFAEFDDGRGIEKLMLALGWPNFRDRMASVFIYKSLFGDYPSKTNMELVEDLKQIELEFSDHSVHGYSRLFMLGFYLKLANLKIRSLQELAEGQEVHINPEVKSILKLSQGRTERLDWLLLIVIHLVEALGLEKVKKAIAEGRKLDELYDELDREQRGQMLKNLLAYGASIKEPDIFLYEKV